MKLFTETEVLQLVTDELRSVNKALKIGGSLHLTETDFQYLGTMMCALRRSEETAPDFQAMYEEQPLGIGA